MSVVSQALDYQIKSVEHPTYQLSKVTQQNGGTGVTITPASGQESIFELPPKVMNLSESILSFTATYAELNGKYTWVYTEGIPLIRQIQLYTRTGVHLVDINDLNKYMKCTMRMSHKVEDVITWDKVGSSSGYFEGLSINNSYDATTDSTKRPNHTGATASRVKTTITEILISWCFR
eukprot:Lithocolla_globosa_v1_NODE_121_length_6109_cov_174.362075.p3 type:complete len:177 gc:universal NODE_121_length_6109_cov_174.362075:3686-3156(-)